MNTKESGLVIHAGESIPANVIRFADRFDDEFTRAGDDERDSPETARLGGPYIVKHYAPLRVLEVAA